MMLAALPGQAAAASCGNDGSGFGPWLADFKAQAAGAGISRRTLDTALGNIGYSRKVISLDRNQKAFNMSFDEFMNLRAPAYFVTKGKKIIQQNASMLNSIERRYGVQKEILVAIWGMETGFGANSGSMNVFQSLATLAYDCRRSAFFAEELMAALAIVDRGDMSASQMRGAWAGEIGQTQFLAKNYLRFAVDGDGDGRRDLIRSRADVLASTANFLHAHGWRPGADYQPGQPNFGVLQQWNKAAIYQKALAVFAGRLAS
ncbi:lytic murein transglycosylase [Consotaella sp. CSK11QG-6]